MLFDTAGMTSDAMHRMIPRLRQRVRSNPLSIAPPRWEVDPNFDLSYHLRHVRAAGDRDLRAVLDLARAVAALPRLVLRGLMTIPDPVAGFEAEVALHRRATTLFERVQAELALPQFDTLSMGMTADLEAAIAAGSTMVRVGTAIFGQR